MSCSPTAGKSRRTSVQVRSAAQQAPRQCAGRPRCGPQRTPGSRCSPYLYSQRHYTNGRDAPDPVYTHTISPGATVSFRVIARCPSTGARAGLLSTAHGDLRTPLFMPVGTQATVKSLTPHDLMNCGASCILANTYHLALRPGADLVSDLGGLHRF